MPRSRWDSKSKALIVLEGLKGKPVADICREYQISQSHYYRWRDKFLANMHQAFEDTTSREARLSRQVNELKQVVGELTLELKKSETDWS
jgi:transposase-like protein